MGLKARITIPAVLAVLTISTAANAAGRNGAIALPEAPPAADAPAFSAMRAETPSGGAVVVAEAERWLGARNPTGKRGPWCAHFASYVLERTGRRPLANGLASSALSYGRRLKEPKVGALAVVTTRIGYAAHVGFVAGVNADGSIDLISGNWGRRVSDAPVQRRSVVAFVDVI